MNNSFFRYKHILVVNLSILFSFFLIFCLTTNIRSAVGDETDASKSNEANSTDDNSIDTDSNDVSFSDNNSESQDKKIVIENSQDSDSVEPVEVNDSDADKKNPVENEEISSDEQKVESFGDLLLDASLEELLDTPIEVWTATKTASSIEEAPSIIEVITKEDLARWGYEDVADALRHMTGFYVVDDHILPNASVRGISGVSGVESGLIKVMINGRSVAFRSTSANWLGTEMIPISAVERIEVIRGPASALYGADAFLATVNVVLKKPEDINGAVFRGKLGSEVGHFSNFDSIYDLDSVYDVTGGMKRKNFGLLLSFSGENSTRDGLRLPDTSPLPIIPNYNSGRNAVQGQIHNSRVWYAETSYAMSKGSITLSGYGSTIDRSGDFAQWAQLTSGTDELGRQNGTRINLQQHLISLDGKLVVSDKLTLSLNNTFFTGRPLKNDRIEIASDLYYIKRDFKYRGFNTVAEGHIKPLDRLTIVAGFEMVFDHELLPLNQRVDKQTDEIVDDSSQTRQEELFVNPGVYLQAHLVAVPEFLQLTGGVRYDYHNVYGSQVTGRAGSVFLWTKNFSTKLLYGSAFKAPSPHLLYADPIVPGDVIGNDDLLPQYVHTVELSPSLKTAKYLTLRTTLAYNIILDKAEFVPQGFNKTALNLAEVHSLSWETSADLRYKDIVNAYLGFELQHVVHSLDREGYQAALIGRRNNICPPWIVRAGVSSALPFIKTIPVRLGLRTMIVAPRRASGDNIVAAGGAYELPVYGLLGASLSITDLEIFPAGKTTFSLRAENLLDAKGPDPGFNGVDYPLLSRRIFVELSQVF